jgi:hypothetical protein
MHSTYQNMLKLCSEMYIRTSSCSACFLLVFVIDLVWRMLGRLSFFKKLRLLLSFLLSGLGHRPRLRFIGSDGTALSPGNGKGGGPENWYRPAKIIMYYYMMIRCFVGNCEQKILNATSTRRLARKQIWLEFRFSAVMCWPSSVQCRTNWIDLSYWFGWSMK